MSRRWLQPSTGPGMVGVHALCPGGIVSTTRLHVDFSNARGGSRAGPTSPDRSPWNLAAASEDSGSCQWMARSPGLSRIRPEAPHALERRPRFLLLCVGKLHACQCPIVSHMSCCLSRGNLLWYTKDQVSHLSMLLTSLETLEQPLVRTTAVFHHVTDGMVEQC